MKVYKFNRKEYVYSKEKVRVLDRVYKWRTFMPDVMDPTNTEDTHVFMCKSFVLTGPFNYYVFV